MRELSATAPSIASNNKIAYQNRLCRATTRSPRPPPGEIAHADNAIVEHFINKWKMEQAAT